MSKKRHHRKRSEPTEPGAPPSPAVPSSRRSPTRWALAIGAIAVVAWLAAPRLLRTEAQPSPHRADTRGTIGSIPTRPARMTETPDAIDVRVPLSDAPAALRIVWIGDQRARVAACECHRNLRLAFVATLFRRLAAGPPRTLLLDVGGAIDGGSPLDRARQETYAATLKDLGFAAVAVGAGRGYLSPEQTSALAAAGPPLLTLGGPALRVPLGTRSISFVCSDSAPVSDIPGSPRSAAAPRWTSPDPVEQATQAIMLPRAQGDLVVLLGDLSPGDAERIAALPAAPDVILSARPFGPRGILRDATRPITWEDPLAQVGRTSVFGIPASSFGAVRWLEIAGDGTVVAYGFYHPAETIAADPQTTSRVDAFLRKVASEPALSASPPRRFASEPRENDATDAYVGSDACIRCHAMQGTQWRGTRHSEATKALETIDRHYYPGCITCHSTGYGWPTGYRTRGGVNGSLRDVGCETCHGPGRRHSEAPKDKVLIRRGSSTLCLECHDGREAKPLGDGLEKAYERIRH